MPNYKVHDNITLISSILIGSGVYSITKDIKVVGLISSSVIIGGMFLNGDLDWDSSDLIITDGKTSETEVKKMSEIEIKKLKKQFKSSRIYKRWGIFRFIWWPYKKIFRHRSFYTHGLFIGEIIRFLYLLFMFPLILFLIYFLYYLIVSFKNKTFDIIVLSKVVASDFFHYFFIIKDFFTYNFVTFLYIIFGLTIGSLLHSLADMYYPKEKTTK